MWLERDESEIVNKIGFGFIENNNNFEKKYISGIWAELPKQESNNL